MPSETFLNLSEEKRSRIIETCIEEFALHDYKNASISRIVKKLEIAKGSIYQYFESKKELYFYLIEYATKERFRQIDDLFDSETDFFELIVKNFIQKVKFDIENPVISGFQYNLFKERNSDELGNLQKDIKLQIIALIKEMINSHQHEYQLRIDIDIEYLAFLVMQVQIGIYDFLEIYKQVDFRQNILNRKPIFSISESEIEEIVRSFSELLKNGMSK